jgi:2-oxoglutarate dehydrogenase E2 component (dihydrolipoamide succinyltransferase)
MTANILVPEVGESIVDARVARWLKKAGDSVSAGEPLVELETDKVDVEVAAPKSGVLQSIAHADGADVKIGDVLGVIETDASTKSEVRSQKSEVKAEVGSKLEVSKAEVGSKETGSKAEVGSQKADVKPPTPSKPEVRSQRPEISATPSARRLAREQGVPLGNVMPSGPRVTRSDVARAAGRGEGRAHRRRATVDRARRIPRRDAPAHVPTPGDDSRAGSWKHSAWRRCSRRSMKSTCRR